ncbi:unnamed protein product [Hermetia illucens]|uniref:Uncharacterized protein n=1 Tax=Hermetia illucens TaxID=343691 RepID=A0A7R8UYG4_HERIL|nr:unnamed protein product [Hermetia illucens]
MKVSLTCSVRNIGLKVQNLQPTVEHGGGNVMVWGCTAAAGVGKLERIDGILEAPDYVDILRRNLRSSVTNLLNSFRFKQDNDRK